MNPVELFPPEKFAAYLFDCDGTIAHSMPVHLDAWNAALKPFGGKLTNDEHMEYAGRPTNVIVGLLNEKYGWSMPPQEVSEIKERNYMNLINTVKAVPDVRAAILALHGKRPMAVVSGSPRESIFKTLTHLDLLKYFDAIVGAEDYKRGKPAPDCFLNAAGLLKVEAKKCLVFEDGELGIEGAKAAGMGYVRVIPDEGTFDLTRSAY